MRKLALTIGSLAMLGGIIGTAGAASASTTPVSQDVQATVTIQDYLTASFSASSVDFGSVTPGTRSSVPHAENITAGTSLQHGASLSLTAGNDGFVQAAGMNYVIPDSALSVTNRAGQEVHAVAQQPVLVDTISPGTPYTNDQTWALDVASTVNSPGAGVPLHASFALSVVGNA